MRNRLIALVESGRLVDETGLKGAFRSLAKRLHPDLAAGKDRESAEAFMRLRAEYEEAMAFLAVRRNDPLPSPPPVTGGEGQPPRQRIIPLPWSVRSFYENLEDLLARGFPRLPGKQWPSSPLLRYEASRERVMRLLAGRDWPMTSGKSVASFLEFEEGFTALAIADPAGLSKEVRISRSLRNLLSNVVGFHETGFVHLARYAHNEWPRLEAALRSRDEIRPIAFLAMIMADLEAGPAFVDR